MTTQQQQLERGRNKSSFIYRQLAELVGEEIASGSYASGEKLPGMEVLATKFDVTKITMRRALKELEKRGVIRIEPAKGCFVAPPEDSDNDKRTVRHSPRNTLTVGVASCVVYSGRAGFYHMEMLEALRSELSSQLCNMVVLPNDKGGDWGNEVAERVFHTRLDGIIYIGPFDDEILADLVTHGPTAVLIDYSIRGKKVDCFLFENSEGSRLSLRHLWEQGRRKLAIISGSEDQLATLDRAAGLRQACEDIGLDYDGIPKACGHFVSEEAYLATMKLLTNANPDGLICMNDEMALGAYRAIHELGLKIPDDIAIVGFDDIPQSASLHPPLTSVAIPVREASKLAVRALLFRMQNQSMPGSVITLGTDLKVRSSSMCKK